MGLNIYGLYSDFGGGCKVSARETPIATTERELVEEMGMHNARCVLATLNSADGTSSVLQCRDGSYNTITHMTFVWVDITKMKQITPNSEMEKIVYIPHSSLSDIGVDGFHFPIRRLVNHLINPNHLMGYECSIIQGSSVAIVNCDDCLVPKGQSVYCEHTGVHPQGRSLKHPFFLDRGHRYPSIVLGARKTACDERSPQSIPCVIG
jgi:hypothetical protein